MNRKLRRPGLETPGAGSAVVGGNSGNNPTTPCALIHFLPLAISLKKALVLSASEGYIPREHATQLLTILGLRGV
jgi:hypothetical protein